MLSTAGPLGLFQLNEADFDFSLQFEQLFFSVLPSALFILTSLWRTVSQLRKPTVVRAPMFQLIKVTAIAIYVGLELSLLVLSAVGTFQVTGLFIAASVLQLLAALSMIAVSLVDHSKSARPSVLLSSFLFLTLLLDAAQARTLFLTTHDHPELTYSSIFSAALSVKVIILLLEAQRKSRWVLWDEKNHSPEETSGIFSLGVFFWLNRVFLDGYKKVLTLQDLYPLDSALHSGPLHESFMEHAEDSQLAQKGFGLLKLLVRTLWAPLLLPVLPRLALLGFTFCQPFFIERLLGDLSSPSMSVNDGYGFIGASILIYSGIAISSALYWYFQHRLRIMIRAVLVTEIFHKATKARTGDGDSNATVTLMSTDIERIDMGLRTMHEIWASVIQVGLAAWLLYRHLGVVFVAPIGVVTTCFLGLTILLRYTGDSQHAWMAAVQKRVGLTASVISSMKNLKMSGLSLAIGEYVQKLRIYELAAGSRFRKIAILAALLGYTPELLSPPLAFAFAQRDLNAVKIFTSLSYLLLMTKPLSQLFQNIPQFLSALACMNRIQTFLASESRRDFREILGDIRLSPEKTEFQNQISGHSDEAITCPITVHKSSFGWQAGNYILRDIDTRIAQSSLTMVVGPVGSGKSTLARALLGEIPYYDGRTILSTRFAHVGFCDQTAFLSNGSIRENIVGFAPFDEQRYHSVIEATDLVFDLQALPLADHTNVGSEGIALSGGQKQRVSLARALYLHTDLLVLDDVFSGLDADTEERVFSRVFGPDGLLRLRRTTVVLCTHSVRHLPHADHIIALGDGSIVEQGSFNELMVQQGYVSRLRAWEPPIVDASSGQNIPDQSEAETQIWKAQTTVKISPNVVPEMSTSRQMGNGSLYKHYYRSIGLPSAIFCLLSAASWGFFTNFPTIWLTFWSYSATSPNPSHSWAYYGGIYALFQICALVSLFVLGVFIFIVVVTNAGTRMHRGALHTLIRAPLAFFTSTDTGSVTNLFSQDLNLVDTELPSAMLNLLCTFFEAIAQAAVLVTSSAYLAISYPFLGGLLYVVQRFYLRTSRQLRLLDLEAKSPLYTHFLDMTKGITTLRAFGFISDERKKNEVLVHSSQRPAYLLLMIQQWLNLLLDVVVMIMAAVLTTLAVRLRSSSGFTGASLVTLMSFGETLSYIVIFYTKLETSIGAIGRLKTFSDDVLPEDTSDESIAPLESWPSKGVVEIRGVSASYETNPKSGEPPKLALRDINLRTHPGEKLAICGRTGSGKSSLVALLLKLLDPIADAAGNAVIDDIPLHRIDRTTLRQRVLAVPQEAVFLPDGSTFRENLDPFNASHAHECEAVLAAVGMERFVQGRGGLDAGMSASTLSAGQKQLMSLGRVLLRQRIRSRTAQTAGEGNVGGLLLLDEISSSVDYETERAMQEIIRTEFREYTVIAVSHRLDMIMDFDRVVVMDTGRILEVGNPTVLRDQEDSRFGDLVRASAL